MLKKDYPELAKYWNYDRNNKNGLYFKDVSAHSGKKAWWICEKGHEWEATIDHISNGTRCPYCANIKVLPGYNDLATVNPQLSKEWNYERNEKLLPEEFLPGSEKKIWWRCSKGHEWEAMICTRNKGIGCPICAGKTVLPGFNDLATTRKDLLEWWNYEKNQDVKPTEVSAGTHKIVWWKCPEGHEWKSRVSNVAHGRRCPYCAGKKVLKGENDLKTLFPEIAAEWNYKKNKKTPDQYRPHSNNKVWWICEKGHEWEATIGSRVDGTGCPFCSGRRVLKGENDLATTYPELLKEWDYDKNTLDPSEVSFGSNERVWWKCKRGHSWQTKICNRTVLRRGCSLCSKDLRTSFPELAIYYYVKKYFADVESGNRKILDGLELDIFIPEKNIAIEYDGVVWHKSNAAIDREKRKNSLCKQHNIKLIRIREFGLEKLNDCVCIMREGNDDYSLDRIIMMTLKQLGVQKPDVDVKRDRFEIYSLIDFSDKENSLQNKFPEIAAEWNYEKNGKLSPSTVSYSSNIKVWWKCKNGHEWESNINNRLRVPVCPYCNGKKIIPGFNDLATVNPTVSLEWNYERNRKLTPDNVFPNSGKKVWWKCEEGHEWEARIQDRNRGQGCPYCNGYKVMPGINDLQTLYPELCEEWDYEKNKDILPSMVSPTSSRRVWWKCPEKGHHWKDSIQNRVNGAICRECTKPALVKKHYVPKSIPENGSLADIYPNIAAEWDYSKNNTRPNDYFPHSQKSVWWICKEGHEYEAKIGNRTSLNRGCPYCSGRYAIAGKNDFKTTNPELLKYWDYSKNTKKPSEFLPHSQKKVWWTCERAHSYQRTISSQVLQNGRCPYCINKKDLK